MLISTAGDSLRHARWAKRLSIKEAAAQSEVSTKTIVKLENGGTTDRGEIIYALCRVYEIDPAPLFADAPQVVNE